MEASGISPGEQASMTSPLFEPVNQCMVISYHMYGSNVGKSLINQLII